MHVGERVSICGWVASQRSHGSVTFVNLRDHTGIVQVTTDPINFADTHKTAERLHIEYVVAVEGTVLLHPKEVVNARMATGLVEAMLSLVYFSAWNHLTSMTVLLMSLKAKDYQLTSICGLLGLKLKVVELDLRWPQMSTNVRLHHPIIRLIQRYLEDVLDFVEIETPILTRSTPGCAHDYLVPSHVQVLTDTTNWHSTLLLTSA
ncbi:unnamed protein product [Sphagnum balticum]